MQGNRLYKYDKLCSHTAVDEMFDAGKGVIAYPLRAVFRIYSPDERRRSGCKFLITIPKKKIRHAVDRVLLRRRVREAYRLNRHVVHDVCHANSLCIDVAFIYLSTSVKDYAKIESRMCELLGKIEAEAVSFPRQSL